MESPAAATRLVQLFERELRILSTREPIAARQRELRMSNELERQIAEFVSAERSSGSTPERMLVDLKALLARVAPDVPRTDRMALIATLTGRAIDAFYGSENKE